MQKTDKSITEYLDSLPEEFKSDIKTLDKEISEIMKSDKKTLWEGVFWGGSKQQIIGYGDYIITRSKKPTVEWFYVGLSVQKNYISLYIMAIENGKNMVKESAKLLGKAKAGSSSVSFKKLEDTNLDEILKLVKIAKKHSEETD